jgi:hypothetical protein
MVYRLYSVYGCKLTQREVSRAFPEWSLVDFKRILRAFNITKATSEFAPHIIEEHSPEELLEMSFREKENNLLTTIEQEAPRRNAKLIQDQLREIIKLKSDNSRLDQIVENFFKIDLSKPRHKLIPKTTETTKTLVIHLSDLHVGAKVDPNSLYANEYNVEECRRRLAQLAEDIASECVPGDQIIINLLGDMLDGFDNTTARRSQFIPQNLNNFEQVRQFLNLMDEFFVNLLQIFDPKDIFVFSVQCGNHAGASEYAALQALMSKLQFSYNIACTLSEEFFLYYEVGNHSYVLTHGKDANHMKRGLPINLDDKTQLMVYDWLKDKQIDTTDKIVHVVKGDLHQDNINNRFRFDYRNVLSLFGASDYSQMNFSRSSYGVSYDVIKGNQFLRGNFLEL